MNHFWSPGKLLLILILLQVSFFLLPVTRSYAQVCPSPGKDGSVAVLTGVVNTYYPVTSVSLNKGDHGVSVGSSSGATQVIQAGDLLMLIQMQDATINSSNTSAYGDGSNSSGSTAINGSGAYELLRAASGVVSGVVTVQGSGINLGLLNAYETAPASAASGIKTCQLIRIPQYQNVILGPALTALNWNGSIGGILAVDIAGSLNLNSATVDLTAKGFRGGGAMHLRGGTSGAQTDYVTLSTVGNNSSKGEGIAGTPRFVFDVNAIAVVDNLAEGYPSGSFGRGAPGNAGGGGTDANPLANDQNTGGGGGGNGAAGGKGGNSYYSNLPYGGFGGTFNGASLARIILGGGGGAGVRNDGTDTSSSGGAGGGMIFIHAGSVLGTGNLIVNGGMGFFPKNDGGGGGGAAGTIIFTSGSGTLSGLSLAANGGAGANANISSYAHGPGGGGSGGIIYTSTTPGTVSLKGGISGYTSYISYKYGATDGGDGVASIITASAIPGIIGGSGCIGKMVISKSFLPIVPVVNGTVTFTVGVKYTGPVSTSNTLVTDTIPSGYTYVSSSASTGTYSPKNGWVIGTMSSGSSATLTVVATVKASGNYLNIARVSSSAQDKAVSIDSASVIPVIRPLAANDSAKTQLNTRLTAGVTMSVLLNDMDPQGQQLKAALVQTTGHGALQLNADGSYIYTPASNYIGSDFFTYVAVNVSGLPSDPATVKITVTGAHPVAVNDSASTLSNKPLRFTAAQGVLSNDIDPSGGILTAILLKTTLHGMLNLASDGSYTYLPALNYTGSDRFTYYFTDPAGLKSDSAVAVITIYAQPPAVLNDSVRTLINQPVTLTAQTGVLGNDTDPQGQKLVAVLLTPVRYGMLTLNPDGSYTYQPGKDFTGTDSFTYKAVNTSGLASAPATVTINVSPRPKVADLAITIIAPPVISIPELTYYVTIRNNGPDTSSSAVMTNVLPSGTTLDLSTLTTTNGTVTYDAATRTISWTGKKYTGPTVITYKVAVNIFGTLINTATVTGAERDDSLANNTYTRKTLYQEPDLFFPTLFTPGSGMYNRSFVIRGLASFPDNSIEIFNRWGNKIYTATSYGVNGKLWDGSGLNEGTYYYILRYQKDGKQQVKGGYITLKRNR